ncbi:MAG: DUF748 domain-containing protein [Bacteroidales bacterium]|nr:DUF748 domain-containing protein [Bacteroidales bacterium]
MNKTLRIILIIILSIAALFVLVSLLASPIAKTYVNNHGEDLIGRKINVDKLRVNACMGRVKIYDFAVYEDDGTTPFLTFDTLDVSVKLRKLLAKELCVRHLILTDLDVLVLQNGDKFNFTSIIDHFKSDEPKDTTPSNWDLGFYNIRLSHWRINYNDQQKGSEWKLRNINIAIPGVYFSGKERTEAGVTLALAEGGSLSTVIRYTMETNDFDIDLKLDKFSIANAKAYLTDVMNVGTLEGAINADLHAKGNLSQITQMTVNGNVNLNGTDLRDLDDTPILQCSKIDVDVNNILIAENKFDITSITIDNLSSRFDRYAASSNFSRLFDVKKDETKQEEAPSDTETDTSAAKESKPLNLIIRQFRLNNSDFTFYDHTLPALYTFPVTKIRAEADSITLSGNNALKLFATLPHGGLAIVNWKGTLDDMKRSQQLRLIIKNLQLKDLSPYSVAYLAQPFTNGVFSFTSHNTIKHSELKGDNHIDIYKPEVGDRQRDVDSALNIPLRAALYVLKDKNDKIQLDIPVKGNIDNPEFNYMKLVWKTLGNLLVKVATSPARGIANALGISGSELEFLPFDATQRGFTSEQYYVMDQLAQIAEYDSNVVIMMEQQISASANDSTLQMSEGRNMAVRRHMEELGVPSSQLEVTTALTRSKKTGYAISSRYKE